MPYCPLCPGRFFKDSDAVRMHRESKHTSFECEYCDREFKTDDGRLAHQKAKHVAMFECRHCDIEFTSEQAREQHEDAKHFTFECRHCDREFASEQAREQHEDAKHYFECTVCDQNFTRVEALRQHKQAMIKCNYCTTEFCTRGSKNAHQRSCRFNPANRVAYPPIAASTRPHLVLTSLQSKTPKPMGGAVKESSTVDLTTEEESQSPASSSHSSNSASYEGEDLESPSPSSDSALDKGETHYSTSEISSAGIPNEGATAEQASPCTHSLESCVCHQTSSLSSNTDKPSPGNAGGVVSADDQPQDNATDLRTVIFHCTPCIKVFDTEKAFRDHVCAFRTAIFRPHCSVCYTQFDDESLLQQHLEGLQCLCHLCPTRCCSDEMLQDHLLSHPTCGKCGKSFADDLALCAHVESDHPVVVCWDCDGVVVEKDSLESHYADSSAHPSCAFCGVGKRSTADMDEHVRRVHASSADMEDHSEGGNVHRNPDETSPVTERQPPRTGWEETARQPLKAFDRTPPPSVVEVDGPLVGPNDEPHNSPLQTESSMPPQVGHVHEAAAVSNGEGPRDDCLCPYALPSPTPSEQGSDASGLQLLASQVTNTAVNNNITPPSPASSVSAEPFSDTSTQSSRASSSDHSVVFISADGIPDYVRENRAVLVATSAGSASSGHTPLRLPSSSSLESLEIVAPLRDMRKKRSTDVDEDANRATRMVHRVHCRICLADPCEDMTATMCGHVFCKRCITRAVIATSACPVCKSATLLYCLFKLDLSV